MTLRINQRALCTAILCAVLALLLNGCGTGLSGGTASATAGSGSAITFTGKLYGGQQAVVGAAIQLYAVGITGTKSAATPLIAATALSGPDGTFSITGLWNCTSDTAVYGVNPQLYIVATGGNPGLGSANTPNPALAMMSALGPCNGLTSSSYVYVNEITTVASVAALAPFMADITHVGALGANAPGLVNAFKTANVLANMATGATPGAGLPATTSVPSGEIEQLADILAGCVNSNGAGPGCMGLFGLTTPSGGPMPTNTIAAMLSLYSRPAVNVGSLLNLIQTSAPFGPVSAQAPADWTIALTFTGNGLSAPAGVAVDASGNAWIANASGNSVTGLSNTGATLTGASGYSAGGSILGAQGIAVDRAGNVWVADTLINAVTRIAVSGGAVQSSATYTSGGLNGPMAVAIDSQNNAWISNFAGGSVTELSPSGVSVGQSPLTANASLQNPAGIAIDAAGNVWVADNGDSVVAEFGNDQSLKSGAGFTDNVILAPEGVAIDSAGRVWVADNGINAVSVFTASGAPALATPLTGGGLALPLSIALDGSGSAWVANSQLASSPAIGSLSQFTLAGPVSPGAGYSSLNAPVGVAVDASGSVWSANSGDNSVSVVVGVATPAIVPLALTAGP